MDYEKMTKAQLVRLCKQNNVLADVKSIRDITFGHIAMVEDIGRVLAPEMDKGHTFQKIIGASINCYDDVHVFVINSSDDNS